jgi:hypothetical protein
MKIVELTKQLTDNRILLKLDLPDEYKNQKIKILIFPYDDIEPNSIKSETENEETKSDLFFLDLKGIDAKNQLYRREDMYNDFGR